MSAVAARPTLKKVPIDAKQVEADHRQRAAEGDLAVVDQVDAGADHDDRADDRRRRP